MKHKNHILSILIRVIKSHMFLSIGLVIAIVGTIITGVLPPLVLEKIVNRLTAGETILFQMVFLYFVVLVLSGIFDAGKESLITIFGQKVTHGIRSEMCDKLFRLPANYFIENDPGVTGSRFVNDVDTIEILFTSGIISMVVDACKVISILVVIFAKSKGLGTLIIVTTPFLFWLTRVIQKRMLKAQLENRVAVGKVNSHIPETIRSIRMIHTFRKERYMEDCYENHIEDSYHAMEKSNFYDAIYSPIIITISSLLIAIMMICSARGGGMQEFFGMSVGTAVAVITYVGKVFEPLESIGMEIQNIQSAAAGMNRVNELLNEEERVIPPEKEIKLDTHYPAVQLENVRFGYKKEREILHGFSAVIESGENVTLTGRTGAGKSTIFKLLMALYQPWDGNVSVYGIPADQIPESERRKVIGYVEQSFRLIPGTVKDQITMRDKAITMEQVEEALSIVGMKDAVLALENGYDTLCVPNLFSQGQMQLLSIARALVTDPAILLLDEITANLDSATEEKILQALKAASKDRTVISISHRLFASGLGREISIS